MKKTSSKVQVIRCICTSCQTTLSIDISLSGSKETCPECGHKVFIPQASFKTGEIISNKYEIDKLIGIGAMGEVYEVITKDTKKHFALKVIKSSLLNKSEIHHFKNEIRMALRVTHKNFIKAYEAGSDSQGRPYLVMELVKGQTLENYIMNHGRLDEDRALSITLTVAKALRSAWDQWQIIHRDIKPANILISSTNIVKIMDLGVSAKISDITSEKLQVGSPYYMSPEQILTPNEVDQRSDIYSLGATLYEIITGNEPFKGKTSEEIFKNSTTKEPVPPQKIRADLTLDSQALILSLMNKNKANRPKNWHETIQSIEMVLNRHSEIKSKEITYQKNELIYPIKNDFKVFYKRLMLFALIITILVVIIFQLVKSQLSQSLPL